MSDTHVVLAGSRRAARAGARRLRAVDPHTHIEVTVTLQGPKLPSADTPSKTLTPAAFAKDYSVKPADVARVTEVLGRYGLSVDALTQVGRSLHVSGPASAMAAAFHADLGVYEGGGQRQYRGREGELSIPKELADIVTGVQGLDQRQVAYRKATTRATAAGTAPFGPADIESHYTFPSGNGSGQTIAVAEFGEPTGAGQFAPPVYFPGDVTAFCAKYDRPAPNANVVPVNLTPLTPSQLPQQGQSVALDEAGEVMMDVEIIASLCPKANVLVYFATFDQKGWVDLLDTVVAGAKGLPVTLSVSWGTAEDSTDWSSAALAAINERLQIASMHGITVCVASGDDGSSDAMSGKRAHVDFPASSPFVLAVGGTMITGGQEVGWWVSPGRRNGKGSGASGGGVSVKFTRPAWQNVEIKSVNPAPIDGRVVPDVSALAGNPGYDLILDGQSSPNGGTSASAPVWASLLARMNAALPAAKQQRFVSPLLYAAAAAGRGGGTVGAASCTDIITGKNVSLPSPGIGYTAGPGYDAVTGWGVPKGEALLSALGNV
jgi:kumamolisin